MRDSVSKFREEAKKLEDTEALRDVRKKYKVLGDETDKSSKVLKEKLDMFTEKVKEVKFEFIFFRFTHILNNHISFTE